MARRGAVVLAQSMFEMVCNTDAGLKSERWGLCRREQRRK